MGRLGRQFRRNRKLWGVGRGLLRDRPGLRRHEEQGLRKLCSRGFQLLRREKHRDSDVPWGGPDVGPPGLAVPKGP